jgi:hypothetical protein
MPDYSKGKIYTIRFNDDINIYVGSSIQPLSVRFGEHKRKQNSQVYIHIFEKYNGDFKNCYIELYEEFPCESKEQLCKREGEIIRLIGTLNKKIAGRSKKEYMRKYDKEKLEKAKEYREENKEIILEKNKEILKEKNKIKYEKNKEILAEYYINNKEIILEKRKEKTKCECGCEITKRGLNRHIKTEKHINLMSQPILSSISTLTNDGDFAISVI